MKMTADSRQWVNLKWGRIRKSQQLADQADAEWNRINKEINDYMDRMGITDPVQRANTKGESLALKDALAVGNWHSRNAERHIHDLNLFLKLKELDIL